MKSNRTSSFPAVIRNAPPVQLSIAMTAASVLLTVATFVMGSTVAGIVLAVLTVGQIFLGSVIVVNQRHINNKKNESAGP
jgi:hypothetical protein